MRKYAVLLVLFLLLAGCGTNNAQDDIVSAAAADVTSTRTPPVAGISNAKTPNTSAEEDLEWEEASPLYHNAVVRVDGWKQDSYRLYSPEITIITTLEEMNAFRPEADYTYENFDAFRELIKQYDAPIFEYNGAVLIAIHIVDSTGSASYSVESVNISDDAIDIGIERMCPEAFTDDEAQWLVFIELDESKYSGQGVDVELTGV